MSVETPLISVVIPNWNGAHHLPTCLGALRGQSYKRFEVIVVDNGSRDGSVALLKRDYPEVRLVALEENRGFAGGVNAGIRQAKGEIIALLNNDTSADPDWLLEIEKAMAENPQAGMAASKILLFDRRNVLHSAGDLYRLNGVPDSRGVWEVDEGQYDEPEEVFGACGAAGAYRRAMLEEIGLFDEDFWSFCEDVDLAFRAQLAGYRCIYAPRSIVYHRLSATGGGKVASFYTGRNTIYVIAKNYPASLLRRFWPHILRAQLKISWEALRAWRGEAARARLRGQFAALFGLPHVLAKRHAVQSLRRVSDEYIESILKPVR